MGRMAVHADFPVIAAVLIHRDTGRPAAAGLPLRHIVARVGHAALIGKLGRSVAVGAGNKREH